MHKHEKLLVTDNSLMLGKSFPVFNFHPHFPLDPFCLFPQCGHCSEAIGISPSYLTHFLRKLFGVSECFNSPALKIRHGRNVRNKPARRSIIPKPEIEIVRIALKLIT
jgi:hypothetical protein